MSKRVFDSVRGSLTPHRFKSRLTAHEDNAIHDVVHHDEVLLSSDLVPKVTPKFERLIGSLWQRTKIDLFPSECPRYFLGGDTRKEKDQN